MKDFLLGFTDYPEYGEKYSRKLQKVIILAYDHDKYVTIIREGCLSKPYEEIKAGYVYRTRRRVPFKNETLERHFKESENEQ